MIKKRNLDSSLVNYIDNLGMGVEARGALGGTVYYVDNNAGNDAWDGLSIDYPFKTLAKAITVSNLDMDRRDRWARRNTIYYYADTETADLVAFPNKCDVVGLGSYDANTKPGITGNHVPVNAGNYGTRFINVWFKAPADASPIVTLASTTSGCQFIGCTFSATATTTIGIQATASPFLKVKGCRFEGAFVTSFITFGAGESGGTEIIGNTMVDGADNGIVAPNTVTASWGNIISDNLIQCADLTIDDDGDLFYVYRNILVSGENVGSASYDFGAAKSAENYVTGADKTSIIPALA